MTPPVASFSDVSSYVRDSVPRLQYRINLIQPGVSSSEQPVVGKSGKRYGMAVKHPRRGCVCLEMPVEDYTDAVRDDVAQNSAPNQQWISELVCVADGLFPLILFKIRLS